MMEMRFTRDFFKMRAHVTWGISGGLETVYDESKLIQEIDWVHEIFGFM